MGVPSGDLGRRFSGPEFPPLNCLTVLWPPLPILIQETSHSAPEMGQSCTWVAREGEQG